MHVVLVGYRAAGKTTAGRLVAERLGWEYLDVDRGIEAHCGLSIAEIFGRHGEPYYRDVESSVVAEMCAHDDAVVTFGGGTLMRPVNQEHARRDGLVVYLEADTGELWRRIEADPASAATRPNLAGGGLQEVVTMLAQRAPCTGPTPTSPWTPPCRRRSWPAASSPPCVTGSAEASC